MTAQFERLNISKEQVLAFGAEELKRLSNHQITKNIYEFSLDGKTYKSKFSFSKDKKLKIHEKRKEIRNDYNLSKAQLEKLKNGETIHKAGKLIQLDSDINELLSVDSKKIIIPKKIQGISISEQDKYNISKGKEVTLKSGDLSIKVKVNLNSTKGFDVIHNQGIENNKKIDRNRKSAYKK